MQEKVLRRGVVICSLYERAILDVPEIRPYLAGWISQGEEARVYEGELPHKLAIFDRQTVLVHLTMPGDQIRTLFIRHAELAMSLGMLFDSLWEKSGPLLSPGGKGGAAASNLSTMKLTKPAKNAPASKPAANSSRPARRGSSSKVRQ